MLSRIIPCSAACLALFLLLFTGSLSAAPSAKETRQELAPGLSVIFPGVPEKEPPPDGGKGPFFSLTEFSPDNEPAAYFFAQEVSFPWWARWFLSRAPELLAEEATGKIVVSLKKSSPGLSEFHSEQTAVNGFPAVFYEYDDLRPEPQASSHVPLKGKIHATGLMLMVDGRLYLYGAVSRGNAPEQFAKINGFYDSIETPYLRSPGDPDEQAAFFCRLGGVFLILLIALAILAIIGLDELCKRVKQRRLQRAP